MWAEEEAETDGPLEAGCVLEHCSTCLLLLQSATWQLRWSRKSKVREPGTAPELEPIQQCISLSLTFLLIRTET